MKSQSHSRLGILAAPSSRITVPFNIPFSTTLFTICANSSGLPALAGNSSVLFKLSLALSGIPSTMPVSNIPGAMHTALIPHRERSRASGSVRDARAPLAAL